MPIVNAMDQNPAAAQGRDDLAFREHLATLGPGDLVIRNLGGAPMRLAYLGTHDGLIYAGLAANLVWSFELASGGAEYDPGCEWGSPWGKTGSYLVAVERGGADVASVEAAWADVLARVIAGTFA